jgi:hypothetical protein
MQHSDDRFDALLRAELFVEAPSDLTQRLLGLIPGASPMRVPPKRWYVLLVYSLTVAALMVSLGVAWQIYAQLAVQVGLPELLASLRAAPAQGLARLYELLPQSRQVVEVLVAVRDQLHWLLLALVMWAALDTTRRRPVMA